MGNRQTGSAPPSNASKPEIKTPIRKTPVVPPRTRDPSVTPSKKKRASDVPLDKRPEVTQQSSEHTTTPIDERPSTKNPIQKAPTKTPIKKDEILARTAKELKSKDSHNKKKSKGREKKIVVDGMVIRRPGAQSMKDRNRKISRKIAHYEESKSKKPPKSPRKPRKKGSSSSERSTEKKQAKHSRKRTDDSTEKTGEEKTQDSSGRRRKLKNKKLVPVKSSENVVTAEGRTEKTEETVVTKEETAKTENEADDNTLVSDPPVRKKYSSDKEVNVKAFVRHILAKGVKGLKEEFESMKRESTPSRDDCAEFYKEENIPRRRYKDVPCLDESRVVLRDREGNDFIHANYCSSPKNEKRFICTQGPSDSTFNDFWMMINQEDVEYIIMLCNFIEQDKPKCGKYLPQNEGETFETDDFKIQCMALHNYKLPENVAYRKLCLTKKDSDKDRTVHHYLWETWPDRGVPPIDHSLFKLLAKAAKSTKPIIVHCSAGIGRTGTMVTTQIALEMLRSGESLADGLVPVVKKLRKQRAMSVQTDHQYIFIHRILIEYFKDTVDDDEVNAFSEDFKKLTS